jgi:RimJ/RimL family protein N-acetyltransferase
VEFVLRKLQETDLPTLYEHQADPVACEMAAFTPRKREPFMEHWGKILNNPEVNTKVIVVDGEVVGNVLRFHRDGLQEIGYWIDRRHWGRGIASRALALFLKSEPIRPLYAIIAEHNAGSLRVLEKCGFTLIDRNYRGTDLPGPDVVDYLFRLGVEEGS